MEKHYISDLKAKRKAYKEWDVPRVHWHFQYRKKKSVRDYILFFIFGAVGSQWELQKS